MMWRLLVLPVLALFIPPVLVVAYHLLGDGSSASGGSPPGVMEPGESSIPVVQANLISLLRSLAQAMPLEKADARLRGQVDRAIAHLARAIALGITAGACVMGLFAVGLLRGAAARRRMISNFGFSSPTKFLIARNGLGAVLVFAWVVCFLPIQGALIVLVWCVLASMALVLSFMLAKQFPVVW